MLGTFTYRHGRPTPGYFASQARLAAQQGEGGLWLAGVYTRGFDSHESAIESALDAARAIGAGPRLDVFSRLTRA